MNTKISFSILLFALLFSTSMFAQKSEEIKVWGNCGMCKKVIETAAIKAGASTASWSEETKILNVSYKPKKTDAKAIQEAVAASGYDTQDVTAPTEVYNKLHGCCQYERKAAAVVVKDGAKKNAAAWKTVTTRWTAAKMENVKKTRLAARMENVRRARNVVRNNQSPKGPISTDGPSFQPS